MFTFNENLYFLYPVLYDVMYAVMNTHKCVVGTKTGKCVCVL
jgi:hypothetical protein